MKLSCSTLLSACLLPLLSSAALASPQFDSPVAEPREVGPSSVRDSFLAPDVVRGDQDSEARVNSLLKRLEGGRSALEELGLGEEAKRLQRIAEAVRQRSRRAQQTPEAEPRKERNFEDRRTRLEIIAWALNAHAEAGNREAAAQLRQALHVGELELKGAGDDEVARAFQGLTMGILIERLQGAAGLYREWEKRERAAACNALAEYYAARGRAEAAQAEAPRRWDIEDRSDRVDILRMARAAQAESGYEAAAALLGRMVHIGELQVEQGADAEIASIVQGPPALTMEAVIELVAQASRRYGEWGNEERARLCATLADYYRGRISGAPAPGAAAFDARDATEARELQDSVQQLRIQIDEIEVRLAALRAALEDLSK